MADGTSTTLLKYQFDDAAGNAARQGIDSITKKVNRLSIENQVLVNELAEVRKGMAGLQGNDFDKAALKAARLEEQISRINDELRETGKINITDQFDEVSRRVSLAGDFQSNLGALRGLSATAGLGGVGGGLDVVGEIVVLAEELPRLKAALQGLPQTIQAAVQAIGTGNAGMIGATIALSLVIVKLKSDFEAAKAAASGSLEGALSYFDLIKTGTRESLEAQLDAARQQQSIAEARAEAAGGVFTGLIDGIRQEFGDLGLAVAQVNSALGTNNAELSAAETAANAAATELARTNAEVAALEAALASGEVATRSAAEAEAELRKARQDGVFELANIAIQTRTNFSTLFGQISNGTAQSARDRLTQIAIEQKAILDVKDQSIYTAEQLDQLNKRFDQLGYEASVISELLPPLEDLERRKRASDERLAAEKSLIDLASRASTEWDTGMTRIQDIVTTGHEKIADAEKRLSETRLKLSSIDDDLRAKVDDANNTYMQDDLERLRKFIRDEKKVKAEANRQALRALDDHEQNLFNAMLANNIAQYTAEERRFKTESKHLSEDQGVAASERLENFEAEREKARQVRDERIAALNAEADKVRANLNAELEERQAVKKQIEDDLQARVIAEKNALEASMRNLVSSYDRASDSMTATLKAGFAALETAGINTFGGIIGDLQRRAQVFVNQQATSSYYKPPTSSSGVPKLGGGGMAFAAGTLDTQRAMRSANTPQYMWGENQKPGWTEAMIPYKQSEGLASELRRLGLSGGASVNMAGMFAGAHIGGDVSQETLDALEERVYDATAAALHLAHMGGEPN